ncbi:hypothetical protein [Streptomyces nitrosporeus]|uniref:hypothetical protein n=1 Tax=Streptomyces nitrosporeus TaxID=28894 RepID=UPI0039A0F320
MRLFEIPSYTRMVAMEQDRTVYRAWLQHQYGRRWRKRAGAEALLPFTMAPFGLSVDEALALPRLQQEAADARAAAEQDRIEEAAAREEQRLLDAEERAAAAKVRHRSPAPRRPEGGRRVHCHARRPAEASPLDGPR